MASASSSPVPPNEGHHRSSVEKSSATGALRSAHSAMSHLDITARYRATAVAWNVQREDSCLMEPGRNMPRTEPSMEPGEAAPPTLEPSGSEEFALR
jgi:hypothetical protein